MTTERKKPGWAIWTPVVLVGVLLLYVASVPFMYRYTSWFPVGSFRLLVWEAYMTPVNWAFRYSPDSILEWLYWYCQLLL